MVSTSHVESRSRGPVVPAGPGTPAQGADPAVPPAGTSWTRHHSTPFPQVIPRHGYSRATIAIVLQAEGRRERHPERRPSGSGAAFIVVAATVFGIF
jgi:hypothetical protein